MRVRVSSTLLSVRADATVPSSRLTRRRIKALRIGCNGLRRHRGIDYRCFHHISQHTVASGSRSGWCSDAIWLPPHSPEIMGFSTCTRLYELSHITYASNGVCTLCGATFWRSGIPFSDLKQHELVIITIVAPRAACFVVALRQLCVKWSIELLRSHALKENDIGWHGNRRFLPNGEDDDNASTFQQSLFVFFFRPTLLE